MITYVDKIDKNKKQKMRLTSDPFLIKIQFTVKSSGCLMKVVYKSLKDDKKLATLKLYFKIRNGKFQKPSILRQRHALFDIQHKCDSELDLILNTQIYGYSHHLAFKTQNKSSINVESSTELSGNHFVSYVDFLNAWWPPEAIAASIGVPPYSHSYSYNTINLAFWTTNQGPVDAALLWSNAIVYCSTDNPWGNTTQAIQQAWISLYHQYGVKALVSAFGSTDFPTTQGADPIATAEALAAFVINNNLDGVDLDYEDNAAMETSTGVPWLISATRAVRRTSRRCRSRPPRASRSTRSTTAWWTPRPARATRQPRWPQPGRMPGGSASAG